MSRPPLKYRLAAFFGRLAERLSDGWHWLVGPFERFFGRLGEGALGALDSFEGLESAVLGLLRFIFWPITAFFSLFTRWLPSGGTPGSGRVGRAFVWIGNRLYRLAESFNLDGVVRLLVWLLTPVWWPIAHLLGFTNAWLATRSTRELALAVPALLAAAPFAFIALQGAWLGQASIAERYKVAVRDAVEEGDYQRVDLLERKLARLGVDTRRRDFRTALALESDDQIGAAYDRMKRLAPVERPGYPSAHFWIARKMLSGELTAEHEPALEASENAPYEIAEQHLGRLADMEIAGPGVSRLRAFVFAQTDRTREAEQLLKPFSDRDRGAAIMRMRLLTELRDLDAARAQARRVAEMMSKVPRSETVVEDEYVAWALAAELLRDPRQMETALVRWRRAAPDNERPRELLGQYRREQAVRLMGDPTASPQRASEVFIEAARLGASTRWLNRQASALAGAESRHARRIWAALTQDQGTPAPLLQALATAAAGADRIEAARGLFSRLIDQGDENEFVWNNYAWTLSQDPNTDLTAALEAVERALEIKPRDHRFRETRGQVKIALGRWEEAITDLEYALNGMPDSPAIHSSLAKAYEALEKPALAGIHRRQASR